MKEKPGALVSVYGFEFLLGTGGSAINEKHNTHASIKKH